IRSEIRRDAVPRLSMIARAEQKLCADVNRSLLVGAHVDRRVPVEPQLSLSIILFRLDQFAFQRDPVDSPNKAALRFGVNVVCIGRIGKYPETVSAEKIFPAAVGDSARILRIAHPRAIVLEPAENMIRISVV